MRYLFLFFVSPWPLAFHFCIRFHCHLICPYMRDIFIEEFEIHPLLLSLVIQLKSDIALRTTIFIPLLFSLSLFIHSFLVCQLCHKLVPLFLCVPLRSFLLVMLVVVAALRISWILDILRKLH